MQFKTRTALADYGPVLPDGRFCNTFYINNVVQSGEALLEWQKPFLAHPSWYVDRYFWNSGLVYNQVFGSTNRGYGKFNDCVNNKTYVYSRPFSCAFWGGYPQVVALHRINLPVDIAARMTTVGAKKPLPQMDALIQIARMRATCNLVPAFEPYVEMLNFLFELKDFRDITRGAARFFGNHRKQVTDTVAFLRRRAAPSRKGIPASEPTGAIAGGWLFNQFAVQPLLRDMSDIVAGLSDCATEAYQKFKKEGLEPSTMHYSETVHDELLESANWVSYPTAGLATFDTREKVRFTATLQQMYQAPDKTNAEIQQAAWGLRLTPSVLWNATKFTFLFDYFVKIGKALESAHRYQNRINVFPLQYCESILRQNATGFFVREGYVQQLDLGCIGKTTKITRDKPITAIIRSEYSRSLAPQAYCMPLPKFKIPSGKQGLNMLALARVFL